MLKTFSFPDYQGEIGKPGHAAAAMQKGAIVDLSSRRAMDAARLSRQHQLPMADSIILATAMLHEAVIWTQDVDFKNFPEVKYFPE